MSGLPFKFNLFKNSKLATLTHVDVIQRLAVFNIFPISFMQKSCPFVKSSNSSEVEGNPFFLFLNFQICFWWRHRKKDSFLLHSTPSWLLSTSQRTFKEVLTNRTFWHKSLFSWRCSLLKTIIFFLTGLRHDLVLQLLWKKKSAIHLQCYQLFLLEKNKYENSILLDYD